MTELHRVRAQQPVRIAWIHARGATAGLLGVVAALACASGVQRAEDHSAHSAPELFGPGVISTALPEFAITFSPDGRDAYFNRASAARDTLTIMVSHFRSGRWTPAAVAPFSGRYRDVDPFFSPDGRRLYFSSLRPRGGSGTESFDTWYVERRGDGWSEPIALAPPLNTDSSEVFVSIARDGRLVFSSNRHGTSRTYLASPVPDEPHRWSEPEPLRFGTFDGGSNPLITPDGRAIVLVKTDPASGADLYVSCATAAGWQEPVPLTTANSSDADFAPAIDPSGRYLYFTSERPGVAPRPPSGTRPPGDVYRIPLAELGVDCLR
jgi:Tol biopolymer transport system component